MMNQFDQFPIFEYRFDGAKNFPHQKGWVARMKVTGIKSFTLLEGSYVEANDEYRDCRKGCEGKAGAWTLDFFKERSKKIHFNAEKHANFDPKSKAYITKEDLLYQAPSSALDIALGRRNGGWLD